MRSHGGWPFGEVAEVEVLGLALAAVRDMRECRVSTSAAELEEFETDELAGFAGRGAGRADGPGSPL